jgi:amino acid adenylation domain-containing protein
MHNIAYSIYANSRIRPGAYAIAHRDHSISYGDLAIRVNRIAECLKEYFADQPAKSTPHRVGILASRSMTACVSMLSAIWAGATYIPLGLKSPEDRLRKLFEICDLSAIIVDDDGERLLGPALWDLCPELVIKCGSPSGLATETRMSRAIRHEDNLPSREMVAPVDVDPTDAAYVIFTSGTTGIPKGVVISTAAARHYLDTIPGFLALQPGDRVLETCELNFDFSVHNMFATWEVGASLYILPGTEVFNAIRFARKHRLTVWNSVPSLAAMLNQIKALKPGCLPDLRVTVFGGEQLPAGVMTAWQSAAPNSSTFNLYGPTEATVFCLAQPVVEPLPTTPGRDVMSIGKPLPGSEAAVIDTNGNFIADGQTGELAIAGIQLADGYFGESGLTAERFPEINGKRWYLTGDVAMKDAAGNFHCFGRIDNQVKISGYRVELEEIESHLRNVTGAPLVGVVAWPLVDGVARGVVGFIGAGEIDADGILATMKTRVPPYMVPNQLVALAKIPTNNSGKVDRNHLRRLLEAEVS